MLLPKPAQGLATSRFGTFPASWIAHAILGIGRLRLPMKPEAGQSAQLTLLADPSLVHPVHVVELAGRRLRCKLEADLPPGGLVQIEGPGWLLLGEIERLEQGAPAVVSIQVEHALFDTAELARQRQLWTDETSEAGAA